MRRSRLLLVATVVALLVWGGHAGSRALAGRSVFSSAERDSRRLEGAFGELERLRVESYRRQSWCEAFAYDRGRFAESSHPSTCVLFEGPTTAFTPAARADFDRVRRALRRTGVRLAFFDVRYDAAGRVAGGTFTLWCLACSRSRYVYAPGYGTVPPDEGGEMWYRPLSRDWFLVEEDWL